MNKVIKLSLVIIFFLTTYTHAKDVYLSCESTTKFRTSFIINDEKKTTRSENVSENNVTNYKYQKKINNVKNEKIKKSLLELTKVFKEK